MKLRYLLLPLIILGMFSGCHDSTKTETPEKSIDTIPMLVMQIQKCSRLYTSEYQLHKIVTYVDSLSLKGAILHKQFKIDLPVGRRKVAIPMTASVKAYIDLSKFSEKNVRREGNRLEIILPNPEVVMTSTQIDHEAVKQKISIFRSNFSDEEMTRIQRQGREDMLKTLPRLGIVENARQSAARQIIPIIEQMGYEEKNVTVSFRKKFSYDDFPTLIKYIE
jgi:hypothetical protein